jgi:hypothetical protein
MIKSYQVNFLSRSLSQPVPPTNPVPRPTPRVWKMRLLPQPFLDRLQVPIPGIDILIERLPDVDLLLRSRLYQVHGVLLDDRTTNEPALRGTTSLGDADDVNSLRSGTGLRLLITQQRQPGHGATRNVHVLHPKPIGPKSGETVPLCLDFHEHFPIILIGGGVCWTPRKL